MTLPKGIKEDLKMEAILPLGIEWFEIVKMPVFLNVIYRFTAVCGNLDSCFCRSGKTILKFMWNYIGPETAKTMLDTKKAGRPTHFTSYLY